MTTGTPPHPGPQGWQAVAAAADRDAAVATADAARWRSTSRRHEDRARGNVALATAFVRDRAAALGVDLAALASIADLVDAVAEHLPSDRASRAVITAVTGLLRRAGQAVATDTTEDRR